MTTWQRNIATVAVSGMVVVLIFVVLATQPAPAPPATASPVAASPTEGASTTPTATAAASPSSGGSPSPSAAIDTRYGFVTIKGSSFELVTETGTSVQQYGCGTASCDGGRVAVSADGKRVAYWRTGQTPEWELRVFDVATPTSVRTVTMLASTLQGGALAWSSDAQGVVYAAQTPGYGGITGGAGRATVNAVDLNAPQTPMNDVLPARTDGGIYLPIAWDRSRQVFAAVVTGEGGFVFEYAVADANGPKVTRATAGQMIANQVKASPDGKRALGLDVQANVVRIWPITNFAGSFEVRAGPGGRITAAHWQTSNAVGWTYGGRFDVFVPQTDTSRTVYTASSELALVAFRADGSAALVGRVASPGAVIVDVQSGATTPSTISGVAVARPGVLLR